MYVALWILRRELCDFSIYSILCMLHDSSAIIIHVDIGDCGVTTPSTQEPAKQPVPHQSGMYTTCCYYVHYVQLYVCVQEIVTECHCSSSWRLSLVKYQTSGILWVWLLDSAHLNSTPLEYIILRIHLSASQMCMSTGSRCPLLSNHQTGPLLSLH